MHMIYGRDGKRRDRMSQLKESASSIAVIVVTFAVFLAIALTLIWLSPEELGLKNRVFKPIVVLEKLDKKKSARRARLLLVGECTAQAAPWEDVQKMIAPLATSGNDVEEFIILMREQEKLVKYCSPKIERIIIMWGIGLIQKGKGDRVPEAVARIREELTTMFPAAEIEVLPTEEVMEIAKMDGCGHEWDPVYHLSRKGFEKLRESHPEWWEFGNAEKIENAAENKGNF